MRRSANKIFKGRQLTIGQIVMLEFLQLHYLNQQAVTAPLAARVASAAGGPRANEHTGNLEGSAAVVFKSVLASPVTSSSVPVPSSLLL